MATATTDTKAPTTNGYREYVVLAAAVTVRTGRISPSTRKPEVVRLTRGDTINAHPSSPSIRSLLEQRAVLRKDKAPEGALPRQTAKSVFLHAKKSGSATARFNPAVQPIPAPAQVTDPDAILAADMAARAAEQNGE